MTINDLVKKYDPELQFEVLKDSYKQIEYALKNKYDLDKIDPKKVKNIVLTGLGGSAISGDVFLNYSHNELKVPFIVNRNYFMPSFVNENTLVIASSYSGNTEETISATKHALEKGAQILCITTGGKLEELALQNNLDVVYLQNGFQPRYALWINISTLIKSLQNLNFIPNQNNIMEKIQNLLEKKAVEFSRENNMTYKIAESLVGFIPIVYSGDNFTSGVGNRLKEQFNENSKIHSFHNVLPEMNHNEIIGWETFSPNLLNAKIIQLKDVSYHPRVKKRFEVVSALIQKAGCEVLTLESNESEFKVRIFDLIYTGDWISYYLAILRGKDPSEIENINYLKQELAKEIS